MVNTIVEAIETGEGKHRIIDTSANLENQVHLFLITREQAIEYLKDSNTGSTRYFLEKYGEEI